MKYNKYLPKVTKSTVVIWELCAELREVAASRRADYARSIEFENGPEMQKIYNLGWVAFYLALNPALHIPVACSTNFLAAPSI